MKVLFVGPYFFPKDFGSKLAYNVFGDIYEAIEEDVDAIYLLTGEKNSVIIEEMRKIYKKLKIFKVKSKKNSGFHRVFFIKEGYKLIKQEKIDIVTNIGGGISYGLDASIMGRLAGIRTVVRVSGNEIRTRYFLGKYRGTVGKIIYFIDRMREFIAFKTANAIIAMAPWESTRIGNIIKNDEKVCFCPRGVDTKKFNIKQKGKKSADFKVLFIGRKSPEKGYDLAYRAAKLLQENSQIKFIFAGDFDEYKDGNIEYIGYVHPTKLVELYRDVDLVILPSRTEGLPQILLEAMSMQKPCIAPKHIFDGFLENEKTVLLCDLEPEDVAEKILFTWEYPSKAIHIGKNARNFVEKNLDRKKMAIRYKNILLGKLEE